MKIISIVAPCYNEEENIDQVIKQICKIFDTKLNNYDYEIIFIDNDSEDKTRDIIKKNALNNKKIKLISNARNFGHIRSPFHGLINSSGDASILIATDLQDPPDMIIDFVKFWEEGFKVVVGSKNESEEGFIIKKLRSIYYKIMSKLTSNRHITGFTGFGLYDRSIVDELKNIKETYPYFRGLISELGYNTKILEYKQPQRMLGKSKNNFFTLFDMAMLGITSSSKLPLRFITLFGLCTSLISLLGAIIFLLLKIFYWDDFSLGFAPLIIFFFLFSAIQFFVIGVLGEYISKLNENSTQLPRVVEKERINFED
tara:strand:- start:18095 stop:19033 length:939 start_codon:yes stop_codon:yes gene_type:complete